MPTLAATPTTVAQPVWRVRLDLDASSRRLTCLVLIELISFRRQISQIRAPPEHITKLHQYAHDGGSARCGDVAMGGRGRIAGRTWLVP